MQHHAQTAHCTTLAFCCCGRAGPAAGDKNMVMEVTSHQTTSTMLLLLLLLTCLGGLAALWRRLAGGRRPRMRGVPVVPGLPLLGNVLALGRGGVAFITQCRQHYGSTFCLRLLHQRMVFVFEPAALSQFFKAPVEDISFQPAVEQFTQRVYGLPSREFFERHEALLATLRQLLVPDRLAAMGQQLLELAQPQLQDWQRAGKVELWSSCQRLVFVSAGQVLFGRAFFQRVGADRLLAAFLDFEGSFEVAASPVPHLLLPRFRRARASLLAWLEASLVAGDFEDTVVQQLLQGCGLPRRHWPNLLLAVLWASQANSMAALYWSLAFLLLPEQAGARQHVLDELSAVQQQQQSQQQSQQQQQQQQSGGVDDAGAAAAAMLQLALDRRSHVSQCVAEAVRLRLHSVAVRYVSADALVLHGRPGQPQQQVLPRGTVLAICPFESHHDAALLADADRSPWEFQPGRRGLQGLAAGSITPGGAGMAFGGGFWRCPGRWFAEMELALLVQLVVAQLALTLPAPQPPAGGARAAADAPTVPARRGWLHEVLVFGAGAGDGCAAQQRSWRASGDPGLLLPPPELRRLVGFKVPARELWVRVQPRAGDE